MNGINTLAIHNVCEDSLLAAPLMIDLVVLSELMTRIYYKVEGMADFEHFAPVMSTLSYLFKAPMVMPGEPPSNPWPFCRALWPERHFYYIFLFDFTGTPVVNALMKQQRMLTNILCACLGLPPDGDMLLEHKTKLPKPTPPGVIPDLGVQSPKKHADETAAEKEGKRARHK